MSLRDARLLNLRELGGYGSRSRREESRVRAAREADATKLIIAQKDSMYCCAAVIKRKH